MAAMPPPDDRSNAAEASLGALLIRLRSERGLSQKEAASRADIDASTLSRLEKGERGVSREVLDRICSVLALDRQQRLGVLVAAGFLTPDDARVLADKDVALLATLLGDPSVPDHERQILRQYVTLALLYARARGFTKATLNEAAE